jgi:hypothetical protein
MSKLDFILDEKKEKRPLSEQLRDMGAVICPHAKTCEYCKVTPGYECIHLEPHKEHSNNYCNILGSACGKLGPCVPYKEIVEKSCFNCKYGKGIACTLPVCCMGRHIHWQPKE